MKILRVIVIFMICFFSIFESTTFDVPKNLTANSTDILYAHKIRASLLKNYDPMAIPSRPLVMVKVGFSILSFEWEEVTLFINGFIELEWQDSRLQWHGSDRIISYVCFGADEIWRPEVIIGNGVDVNQENWYSGKNLIVQVNADGTAFLFQQATFRVHCNFDYTRWPSLEHNCSIILQSIGYSGSLTFLTLANPAIGVQNLKSNQWEITGTSSAHDATAYQKHLSAITQLEIVISMKKIHHLRYHFIIFPALVILLMLLSASWLPLNLPQKFAIPGLTTCLSILFYIYISKEVPMNTENTPNILRFYSYIACLSILYGIISFLINKINFRSSESVKPMPRIAIEILNSTFVDYLQISIRKEIRKRENILENSDTHDETERFDSQNAENNGPIMCNDQWYQLAVVIDRFTFLVYSVLSLILFFKFII